MHLEALTWILFFVSSIFYIIGYIPGMLAMHKDKSVAGVSQFFWELVILTVSFSFYTLIITGGETFNIIVVGFNLGLAVVMLTWKNILRHKVLKGLLYTVLYIVANLTVYFVLGLPIHVLQTIATVSIILAYVDQIVRFIVRKTAVGTSPYLYLTLGLAIFFLILNMVLSNDYLHVIITEATNLVLILICYFMSIYYRKIN